MQLDAERDEVNWIEGRPWSELGNGNVYMKVTGALIAQLGRELDPETLERLVAAGRLLLGSVLRVDDILDEQPRGVALASRVFGALAGQFEATRKLAQLFDAGDPFWDAMRERYVEFAQSQILEQEYRAGQRAWRDADEGTARYLAVGKNAVMFVASAALCHLAGAPELRAPLDAALTDFMLAAQTLDDAVDWRDDLRQGVPTLVLWRAAGHLRGPSAPAERDVQAALLAGGALRDALRAGLHAIERALDATAFADNPAWRGLCCELERRYHSALQVFDTPTAAATAPDWATADEFWQPLLSTLWRRRPGVLREPDVYGLGAPADVLRALRSLRTDNRRRLRMPSIRCFRGTEEQLAFAAWVPDAADTSLDAYVARLGDDAGVMVSELQSLDWQLCKRTIAFLAELGRRAGAPMGGATLDLFCATAARGFTGLHKDSQDVFTFIVSGTKRFYLWPFEHFRAEAGLAEAQALGSSVLDHVDWRAHVADAVILEGRPGEVFYWPASWWHVAESDDGATTLALGVMHEGNPFRSATAALAALEGEGVSIAERPGDRPADADGELALRARLFEAVTGSERFAHALAEVELGRITGGGVRELPPMRERAALADGDRIAVSAPGGIALVRRDRRLLWSACGRAFTCPDVAEIRTLLELAQQRPSWRVGELLDAVVPATAVGARDKLRAVLQLVARVAAIDVIGDGVA